MADYSMANRNTAHTLGRGRAYVFDISATSGYMGAKYFQEFGPEFLTCPQLVGTWVKNIFRNLVLDYFFDRSSASGYMGEKYFQESGPKFSS